MVNIVIYLEEEISAKSLADELLQWELIASASIDFKNEMYRKEDGKVMKTTQAVLTVQTKAMLFSEIATHIEARFGNTVPIYSLPITQSNPSFDAFIRAHTRKI